MACGFEVLAVMGLIIGSLIASVGYSWHKSSKQDVYVDTKTDICR